jgi:peptidyl-prolyl cis-trans isomerase C
MRISWLLALTLVLPIGGMAGCNCSGDEEAAEGDPTGDSAEHGLTEEQAKQVLAKVGDTTITVGEFAERLADQSPYLRARYNSPERRREFLDNMIRFELLALEAGAREFDKLPEVERTRKQVMVQQMMKELFEDKIQLGDITDKEIREYYEANRDEFHKPEQVRASHILIANQARAQQVLGQLKDSPTDINLFRQLAEEHNEDATSKARFGDLGFFARPGEGEPDEGSDVPAAVAEAAFQIDQIGGIHSELVKTDQGHHIVKLTGRRAALRRSLDEARRPIQNRLWREKREAAVEEFVASLRAKAELEERLDLLDQVRIQVPQARATETAGTDEGAEPGEN